jgi:hypothetical protein
MAEFSWAQVWANAGTTAVTLFVGVKLARFQFNLNRGRDELLPPKHLTPNEREVFASSCPVSCERSPRTCHLDGLYCPRRRFPLSIGSGLAP